MRPRHLVLLLALNCGWATMPAWVTRLEPVLGPLELVLIRYGVALAGMVVVWPWLPGRIPRGRDLWRAAGMGVAVFSAGQLCQVQGIQWSQASDASILLAIDPLVSSLAAALFLQERAPARRWAGFAIAMLGVAAMSLAGHEAGSLPGLGANLLILLSFVGEAVWSVMGKPLIGRWGIPKVTGVALAAGTVANLILTLFLPHGPTPGVTALTGGQWLVIAFLGLVLTAFGYNAWFVVIREAPISAASMTIYLQPIVGTLAAVVVAGERLHAGHLLGGVAIVAGLLLGLRRPPAETSGVSYCRDLSGR